MLIRLGTGTSGEPTKNGLSGWEKPHQGAVSRESVLGGLMLISQRALSLPELAPSQANIACWLPGFTGPFPPPVWMSDIFSCCVA